MVISVRSSNIFAATLLLTSCVFALFTSFASAQATVAETLPLVKCNEYYPNVKDVFTFTYGEGVLYVAGRSGDMAAVEVLDGKQNWSVELGGKTVSDPFVGQDNIYIVTAPTKNENSSEADRAILRSLSKTTGLTVSLLNIPYADKYYLYAGAGSNIVAVSSSGTIVSFATDSNAINWQKDGFGNIDISPAFSTEYVAIASDEGKITALSLIDGQMLNQFNSMQRLSSLAFSEGKDLIYGDNDGKLTLAKDLGNAKQWEFKTGGTVSNIIRTDAGLLVSSFDNFLYLIKEYNGKVTWRRRMPSRLIYSPVVQTNSVIIPIYGEEYILTLNLKDGKFVNRIDLGSEIYSDSSPQIINANSFAILADDKMIIFKPVSCK